MKGALASLASRRAISVLPPPVGPIIRIFFGVISLRSCSSPCERRQRLRSAIAAARMALHHRLAEGDLAGAADHYPRTAAHREYGRAMKLFQTTALEGKGFNIHGRDGGKKRE